MDEIQILSVIDSYDGIAKSGRNKGQPYTKKTLSILYKGNPTEVSAFVDSDNDYYFNVGEIYEGSVVKYRDKLTLKPTNKIIDSNEPQPEPPTHTPTEPKATLPICGKHFDDKKDDSVSKTTTMTPEGTKEVTYTYEDKESKKEKSMQKMNILNNAVAKLCATIKISKPVGGDGTKQVIAFGDAHFNVNDLLKKFIEEFKDYYEKG